MKIDWSIAIANPASPLQKCQFSDKSRLWILAGVWREEVWRRFDFRLSYLGDSPHSLRQLLGDFVWLAYLTRSFASGPFAAGSLFDCFVGQLIWPLTTLADGFLQWPIGGKKGPSSLVSLYCLFELVVVSEIGIPTYLKSVLHLSQPTQIPMEHNQATDGLPDPKREGLTTLLQGYPDTLGKTPSPEKAQIRR